MKSIVALLFTLLIILYYFFSFFNYLLSIFFQFHRHLFVANVYFVYSERSPMSNAISTVTYLITDHRVFTLSHILETKNHVSETWHCCGGCCCCFHYKASGWLNLIQIQLCLIIAVSFSQVSARCSARPWISKRSNSNKQKHAHVVV